MHMNKRANTHAKIARACTHMTTHTHDRARTHHAGTRICTQPLSLTHTGTHQYKHLHHHNPIHAPNRTCTFHKYIRDQKPQTANKCLRPTFVCMRWLILPMLAHISERVCRVLSVLAHFFRDISVRVGARACVRVDICGCVWVCTQAIWRFACECV